MGTGSLLSPRVVSTLGEPFRRGTDRIRTDHAGVGLGLSVAKGITEAHDGTLTLTPRVDGGLYHGAATGRPKAHWQMTSAWWDSRTGANDSLLAEAGPDGGSTSVAQGGGDGRSAQIMASATNST